MPDIDRLFERATEAIAALTQQVSRLAYASEKFVQMNMHKEIREHLKKCRACTSTIQAHDAKHCMACGEFMGDG